MRAWAGFFRFDIPLSFSFFILTLFSSSCLVVAWFVTVPFSAFLWHGLCSLFGGGSLPGSYLLFPARAVKTIVSLSTLLAIVFVQSICLLH